MTAPSNPLGAEVENTLLDLKVIENVRVTCSNGLQHKGRPYVALAHCQLIVGAESFSIVIGVPGDWKTRLFDFFIQDYSNGFPYIPHVEEDGKLCLFDLDLVLVDFDYDGLRGLLSKCVNHAVKIIDDGLSRANEQDFIGEFEAYWMRLPGRGLCILDIPLSEKTRTIHTTIKNERLSKRNRTERRKSGCQDETANTQAPLNERLIIEAACSIDADNEWNWSGTIRNGAYLPVHIKEPLFPPDFRKPLSARYVNRLLSFVAASDVSRITKKCKIPFTAVFHIIEPNDITATIAIHIRAGELLLKEGRLCLGRTAEVIPLSVRRIDRGTLMGRTSGLFCDGFSRAKEGIEMYSLEGKNVLLIGCGSIGGHVAVMLAKGGCNRITLVDPDTFSEENIFRHVLGKESLGKSKVNALKDRLVSSVPGMHVNTLDMRIEPAVHDGCVDLRRFDTVVSATGNHTVNTALDHMLLEKHIAVDAFYAWNEPLDIGCHAAFIPGKNYAAEGKETFCSIFDRDENGMYDCTSYCNRGQHFERRVHGCGNSFVPYSNEASIKSSLLVIALIKKVLSGTLDKGTVVSEKGDGYWFGKEGFLTSAVYEKQIDLREFRTITSFARHSCEEII